MRHMPFRKCGLCRALLLTALAAVLVGCGSVGEAVVYPDAEPGEGRVEVVRLSRRVEGEVFGVRVTGVVYGGEETRIHVPEGSIAGDAMR